MIKTQVAQWLTASSHLPVILQGARLHLTTVALPLKMVQVMLTSPAPPPSPLTAHAPSPVVLMVVIPWPVPPLSAVQVGRALPGDLVQMGHLPALPEPGECGFTTCRGKDLNSLAAGVENSGWRRALPDCLGLS